MKKRNEKFENFMSNVRYWRENLLDFMFFCLAIIGAIFGVGAFIAIIGLICAIIHAI